MQHQFRVLLLGEFHIVKSEGYINNSFQVLKLFYQNYLRESDTILEVDLGLGSYSIGL